MYTVYIVYLLLSALYCGSMVTFFNVCVCVLVFNKKLENFKRLKRKHLKNLCVLFFLGIKKNCLHTPLHTSMLANE